MRAGDITIMHLSADISLQKNIVSKENLPQWRMMSTGPPGIMFVEQYRDMFVSIVSIVMLMQFVPMLLVYENKNNIYRPCRRPMIVGAILMKAYTYEFSTQTKVLKMRPLKLLKRDKVTVFP